MDCPETDRTRAWIDGEVKDAAIASHVQGCSSCSDLARSRRFHLRATAADSEIQSPARSAPDDELEPMCFAGGAFVGGRYRIVRFIARGGMGEVYEAFDEELRVRVALKVATRSTGSALDRFRREVMLARRVTHRNVCRLFEIGFETIGSTVVPYCTMELLEGTTLSERLAAGPLAIAEARSIVQQIATGLQAAHDVGVIHRDFKSNNILLVPDGDGRERAVISDFGLARAEAAVADESGSLTNEQALIGTPAYMAPEQVECKPVTPATDIYALGIVMFELVTGELPFRAETPMATAILRLKQAPPLARSRRPELPAPWDDVIARCLELEPARRFARASDVALALDQVAPPRRAARWAIAAALASSLGLLFALGHAFSPAGSGAAPTATLLSAGVDAMRTILVVDPTASPGDPAAWRATALGELLRAELRVPGRLRTVDGDTAARLAHDLMNVPAGGSANAATARLAAATPAQLLVSGTLRDDRLEIHLVELATGRQVASDGEPVRDDDLPAAAARLGDRLRHLLGGADVVLDADHAAKAIPATLEAARSYAEGLARARGLDHQGAIAALTRATELAPQFGLAFLALHRELRTVRQVVKSVAAAKRAFELVGGLRSDQRLRAEALYRESRKEWRLAADLWSTLLAVEPDDIDVAAAFARSLASNHQVESCFDVLDKLRRRPPPVGDDPRLDLQEALCAREAGDFRHSLSAATRAEVKAGVRGARDVQTSALALEGEMMANAGEYDRAISVLDRAKQLNEASGDHEGIFEALRQLAYVRAEQGNRDEATRVYREALQLAKTIGDRIAEGIILNDLGQTLPRAEDSIAMFREGLAIAQEQDDERLVTALLLNIANKQDSLSQFEDCVSTYHRVIDLATAQQDDQNLATAQMNLGDTLNKLGRRREALPLIDQALASYQRRTDENGVGYALGTRGGLRWGLGDLKGARADFEAALALRIRLGEQRNAGDSQDKLAHLDLAEERAIDAEPLARAALAERRREGDDGQTAAALVTLGRTLVALGRGPEALAAVDEAERLAKPDPANDTGPASASEIAVIRGLAAPANAAAQIAIIRSAHRPDCPECAFDALLGEAEIERAAGHAARARSLLGELQRRAHAAHAEDYVARATLLISITK